MAEISPLAAHHQPMGDWSTATGAARGWQVDGGGWPLSSRTERGPAGQSPDLPLFDPPVEVEPFASELFDSPDLPPESLDLSAAAAFLYESLR